MIFRRRATLRDLESMLDRPDRKSASDIRAAAADAGTAAE